jgi:hypothetical protein
MHPLKHQSTNVINDSLPPLLMWCQSGQQVGQLSLDAPIQKPHVVNHWNTRQICGNEELCGIKLNAEQTVSLPW